jgi:hypothetical protein
MILNNPPASQLVFIGCSPRSGSTLLTRILDSHTRIAAPCEIGIAKYFEGDSEKYNLVTEKYKQICAYYQVNYDQCYQEPGFLFTGVLEKEGKQTLIIKDPRQSLFLEAIFRDFPDAKLIFLVRDARAVAKSVMFRDRPMVGLVRWYEYNTAVRRISSAMSPHTTMLVRYEDLIAHPEQTVGKLVEFLGHQFEPGMLNYGNFTHADDNMSLWQGPPAESHLQTALQRGSISKVDSRDQSEFNRMLTVLYSRLENVRELNRVLGYEV